MLKQLIVAHDAMDPQTWVDLEGPSIRDMIMDKFPDGLPAGARFYHQQVADATELHMRTEEDHEALEQLEGPVWLVVFPGGPLVIVAIIAVVAAVAAAFLLQPKIPNTATRATSNTSPNNELSARTNKARPNGRIPDIVGKARSTPDLLGEPYTRYENHQAVEYSYMGISRGTGVVTDVRDDSTLVANVAGTSVEVYAPYTSPNSGDEPQLRIGTPINTRVDSRRRVTSVNGQVLRSPNNNRIIGESDLRFVSPNTIQLPAGSLKDFTQQFVAGDTIVISNAQYGPTVSSNINVLPTVAGRLVWQTGAPDATFEAGQLLTLSNANFDIRGTASLSSDPEATVENVLVRVLALSGVYRVESVGADYLQLENPADVNPAWSQFPGVNVSDPPDATVRANIATFVRPATAPDYVLDGTYTVLSATALMLELSNPSVVNPDWDILATLPDTATPYLSPTIVSSGFKWVGPFFLDSREMDGFLANFVTSNGLYGDDGKNQYRVDVQIEVECTPANAAGEAIDDPQYFQVLLEGSATLKSERAVSLEGGFVVPGPRLVRARRTTPTPVDFRGADEVKWRDLYSIVRTFEDDFGDITTVQVVSYATAGALALKERQLNLLFERSFPRWLGGSSFTEELYPTSNAADIIAALALDPHVGNRSPAEVDFANLYATMDEVEAYFGTDLVTRFQYTFDKDNLSFQETIASVAAAVFCTAYRRGSILRLSFERETPDSTLLFNHRNKVPRSETRTVSFGPPDNNDGVEYTYVDPVDDAVITKYLPEDQSAVKPKKIESIGVRNHLQAYFQLQRAYNRILFQRITTEFTAFQEADLVVLKDRVLVADNTRSSVMDGQVERQDGLLLTLSQELDTEVGKAYRVYLQMYDGTVDMIPFGPGPGPNMILLSRPPRLPLSTTPDLWAKTTYIIVTADDPEADAFLVTEKDPQENVKTTLRAANYDGRYYRADKDFINGVVDEDGIPT